MADQGKLLPDILVRLRIVQDNLDREGDLTITQTSDLWVQEAIDEIERLRSSRVGRDETLEEVAAAAENYARCCDPAAGLSPYVRENGRHGKSPWAELREALSALKASAQDNSAAAGAEN